jgi:AraC-like DNA-binding protein
MVRFDPSRLDLAPYGFSCKRWAPVRMRRPDRHNEIELNLLTDGWITYLFGGRILRVEANQLAAFWAAIPHQIVDHGGQADYFVVTIPLGWFLRLRLPERFVQALLRGQMIVPAAHKDAHFDVARLSDWEEDFEAHDPKDCTATLLEIEAQLRRLSLRCPDLNDTVASATNPQALVHEGGLAKAEKMAHLVANRYTELIDVGTFAKEVDLHPKHAMKLFHLVFGTSLAAYITEYRISQAQRLLVTTDMSIVDISESAGFGSLSRFNRVFRQMCGCSPRDYRKTHSIAKEPAKGKAE